MEKVKTCAKCGKKFLLIEMELKFYKKQGYPVPSNCPDCRHARRAKIHGRRAFYKRPCDKCGKEIVTIHGPKSGLIVYCEKCFNDFYSRVDPLDPKFRGKRIKV